MYVRLFGDTGAGAPLFQNIAPGTATPTIELDLDQQAYEFVVYFSGATPGLDDPYAITPPWEAMNAEHLTTIGFGGIPASPMAIGPAATWTSRPDARFPATQPFVQVFNACGDFGDMNLQFAGDPFVFAVTPMTFTPFSATPNLASPLEVTGIGGTPVIASYTLWQELLADMQSVESLLVFREDSSEPGECVLQVVLWSPLGITPEVTPLIYATP